MADERIQVVINPPKIVKTHFVYECLTCSPTGHVVYVFDDQTARTIQAALHRTLHHKVIEYQRRNPLAEEGGGEIDGGHDM
jgi:hypothetical protein